MYWIFASMSRRIFKLNWRCCFDEVVFDWSLEKFCLDLELLLIWLRWIFFLLVSLILVLTLSRILTFVRNCESNFWRLELKFCLMMLKCWMLKMRWIIILLILNMFCVKFDVKIYMMGWCSNIRRSARRFLKSVCAFIGDLWMKCFGVCFEEWCLMWILKSCKKLLLLCVRLIYDL